MVTATGFSGSWGESCERGITVVEMRGVPNPFQPVENVRVISSFPPERNMREEMTGWLSDLLIHSRQFQQTASFWGRSDY